jgi:hypothetical protein
VLEPLLLEALVRPQVEDVSVASEREEVFVFNDGTTARTNNPLLKAALVELANRWPGSVAFPDLFTAVQNRLSLPAEQASGLRSALAALLIRSYLANMVAFHCEALPFATEVSARPKASDLSRLMAAQGEYVASLRHKLVPLPAAERALLRLLDGERTVEQVRAAAVNAVLPHFQPSESAATSHADLPAFVDQSLKRFAEAALLVA